LEDLWTDEKINWKEGDEPVCCVCGCEDNEDLEALVLVTHVFQLKLVRMHAISVCRACHDLNASGVDHLCCHWLTVFSQTSGMSPL
jgi:hypothetical protein